VRVPFDRSDARAGSRPAAAEDDPRRAVPAIRRGRRGRRSGQSLVEFALVVPIFFTLLTGIIEFSLALNAVLAVNFASRDAALIASEGGNSVGTDCAVLRTIQDRIGPPADDDKIIDVTIYRSNTVGQAVPVGSPEQNLYARGGSMVCALPGDPTSTIAFHLVGSAGYPETGRCNILAGCGSGRTLDHVGVDIRYTYEWHTPLKAFIGLSGNGYTVDKANSMRMEPIL
jgi:TadE-like protein